MLTMPERIAAFESVLQSAFGLDPVASREGDDWWRFTIGGVNLQGGIHTSEVRASADLCPIETDADLDKLYAELRTTPPSGLARIAEENGRLCAKAALPFASVSRESIERAIRDVLTAVASPEAKALKSRWRSWS